MRKNILFNKKSKNFFYENCIGIGINVWNGERTISRVLSSLFSQTYKNIKIYVLDNQSVDKTIRIINNFKRKYKNKIEIHISSKKTDIPTAQRLLVKKFLYKHKYCLLANDDDSYHKNYIEKLLIILKKKNADLAFANFKLIDEKNKFHLAKLRFVLPTTSCYFNTLKFLIIRTPVPMFFGIYKTISLQRSIKYHRPIAKTKSNYDVMFFLNFLSKNKVVFFNKKIFYYALKERLTIEKNKGGYKVIYNQINSLYKIFFIQYKIIQIFLYNCKKEKIFSYPKLTALFFTSILIFFQKVLSYQVRFIIRKLFN